MDIHLKLNPEQAKRFQFITDKTGAETPEEVVNSALTLCEEAIKRVNEGLVIGAINQTKKTYEPLTTPSLEYVAETREARLFTARLDHEEQLLSFERAMADLDPEPKTPTHCTALAPLSLLRKAWPI